MFGLGEILVLVAVVVLFMFARRLPDLARSLKSAGKSFRQGLGKESEDSRPSRDVRPLQRPPDE